MYSKRVRRALSQTALIVVVVVIVIIVAGGAYAAVTLGASKISSSTTGSCPASSSTINIGVLEPLTGFAAEEGTVILKGAQIAAAQINAAGGVCVAGHGMQVKIFSGDEGTGGTQTINAFNQLVSQDNVSFIIGPDFTGDFQSIFPNMVQTHTIVMTTTCSVDALFAPVLTNYTNYKWMFRMATTDAQNGQAIASVLLQDIKAKNVAFVGEDFIYAHEEINDTIKAASGINPVTQDYFPGTTTDYSSEVTKIAGLHPDATVLVMSGSNALTFTQQYKQNPQTANIPIIETTGSPLENPTTVAGLQKTDPSLLNGILVESLYYTMHLTNQTSSYVASYRSQTGENSTLFDDGAAADAVHVFVNAIVSAGSLNKDAVVSALEKTNYVGVTGIITFDKSHNLVVSNTTRTDAIFEWQNAKPVTIFPTSVADGTYVAP